MADLHRLRRTAGTRDATPKGWAWPPATSRPTSRSGASSRRATTAPTCRSSGSARRADDEPRVSHGDGQRPVATFKDGDGVTFPRSMGGKQTITGDQIAVRRLRADAAGRRHDDYATLDRRERSWSGSGRRGRSSAVGTGPPAVLDRPEPQRDREGRGRGDRSGDGGGRGGARRRAAPRRPGGTALPTPHRAGAAAAGRGAAGRRRLHDRAALRRQGAAVGDGAGRVLRVPLQRRPTSSTPS